MPECDLNCMGFLRVFYPHIISNIRSCKQLNHWMMSRANCMPQKSTYVELRDCLSPNLELVFGYRATEVREPSHKFNATEFTTVLWR